MRKQFAILFCAAFLALGALANTALARDGVYRTVVVDTSRLAMKGQTHLAASLKPMLAGELSKAFGPRLGNSGGRLVVRVTRIKLGAYGGESVTDGWIEDSIEGVIVVPGHGQIPIRVVLPPDTAGAWYAPNLDERRVYRLIEAFAQWTARKV
ncbi:MAG TPA: hypothetical protein PL193_15745 [Xanthobacteraceae bacterium]|nr:hypothetical protein [Xanthobacteraceae bacterium]